MRDDDCIRLLRRVLPRLGMRWPGFRKPRGQVCKRIARRMGEVGVRSVDGYLDHLGGHPEEWAVLDFLCRVTISRFRRDRRTWERIEEDVLPGLAEALCSEGGGTLRCWSAGCASGEEPYTLSLVWQLGGLAGRFPGVELSVLATDFDPHMLFRARQGLYPEGALKELPTAWRARAFEPAARSPSRAADGDPPREQRLLERHRKPVRLVAGDLRSPPLRHPSGADPLPARLHLILCRNLAFTYYRRGLQERLLADFARRLVPGGWLVLGAHEALPGESEGGRSDEEGWQGRGDSLYRHRPPVDGPIGSTDQGGKPES